MAFKKSPAAKKSAEEIAQKEEKTTQLLAEAQAGVVALENSDQWQAFLNFASSFWNYSAYNWAMIFRQKPEATHVAGFQAWKQRGRMVKKGEKGIVILRPLTFKKEAPDGTVSYGVKGFGATYVFDVTQTEGEPLPEHPAVQLTDNAPQWMEHFLKLSAGAEAHTGCTVERVPAAQLSGASGCASTIGGVPTVWVCEDLSRSHSLKTLVHEVAHVCMHLKGGIEEIKSTKKDAPDYVLTRATVEIEAESVAYVVCRHLGLDTSGFSFGYLAQWRTNLKKDTASVDTMAMMARVQKTVKIMLGWLAQATSTAE